MPMFTVQYRRGHYEVYLDRQFFCSADTIREAYHEIEAARS